MKDSALVCKPVDASRTTITELMIPSYANFGGKIHGGHLLSMMDKVAYACASKHAENYCVTVSVEGVNFMQPVEVGDLVSMLASVNYVGTSSIVVGIKVLAENIITQTVKHTNTSFFTMVAKDQVGAVAKVPGLILESREDVRRYLEAIKRKQLKQAYTTELDNAKTHLEVETENHKLQGERCELKWTPSSV